MTREEFLMQVMKDIDKKIMDNFDKAVANGVVADALRCFDMGVSTVDFLNGDVPNPLIVSLYDSGMGLDDEAQAATRTDLGYFWLETINEDPELYHDRALVMADALEKLAVKIRKAAKGTSKRAGR